MSNDKKKIFNAKLVQYCLVGGALGLYYGIFYTPGSEPDVGMAITLSIFAALVTVIVRSWRKGFSFKKKVMDFLTSFLFFAIFMLSITLRKAAYDLGGKTLVIIETVLSGVILGFAMGWNRFSGEVKKED